MRALLLVSSLAQQLTLPPSQTAFVGFRPIEQLAAIVKGVPEFQELFSESTLSSLNSTASSSPTDDQTKAVLRSLFYEAINAELSKFKPLIKRLSDRLASEGADTVFSAANAYTPQGRANASGESEAAAMARVFDISVKTYGEDDVGSLVALALMNLMRLQKGEGAWILADDLHAYVEGDIIECMANSDNMVAHGLGEADMGGRSTFVEMLSYRHLPAEELLLEYDDKWSKGQNGLTRLYKVRCLFSRSRSQSLRAVLTSILARPPAGPHRRVRPPLYHAHVRRADRDALAARRAPHVHRHERHRQGDGRRRHGRALQGAGWLCACRRRGPSRGER